MSEFASYVALRIAYVVWVYTLIGLTCIVVSLLWMLVWLHTHPRKTK